MSAHNARSSSACIALDLEIGREQTLLEFDSAEDRAFSVGSSSHADVRVRRDGVPPVAFYLDRRGADVWLVPGYRRSLLRVDAAIVIAPCRIGAGAVVEFARVRARLAVRPSSSGAVAPPDDSPTILDESTRRSRLAYLDSLPALEDRTLAGGDGPEAPRSARGKAASAAVRPARALPLPAPPLARDLPPPPRAQPLPHGSPFPCAVPLPRLLPPPRAQLSSSGVPSTRREVPRAKAQRLRAPARPHFWAALRQRPFEAAVFALVVGLLVVAVAAAAAALVRIA
jgi:hypothetical protein